MMTFCAANHFFMFLVCLLYDRNDMDCMMVCDND